MEVQKQPALSKMWNFKLSFCFDLLRSKSAVGTRNQNKQKSRKNSKLLTLLSRQLCLQKRKVTGSMWHVYTGTSLASLQTKQPNEPIRIGKFCILYLFSTFLQKLQRNCMKACTTQPVTYYFKF